jgi:CDP-diacylglycerol--glycerol-3-phosphate 3-phosphatidyltransferase
MISIYRFKPQFQALLHPAAHALSRLGMSANQVTVFTCLASIVLGGWLATHSEQVGWFLLVPLWCFLRMALNAIDGIMARQFGEASVLGAYLNEMGDVVSDAALYLPFALIAGASAVLVVAVIFLACLAEFAGVLGILVGGVRRHDGPMGKSDRAFVFGTLGLVVGLGAPTDAWMSIVLAALAVLLVVTTFNRMRSGIRHARQSTIGRSRE